MTIYDHTREHSILAFRSAEVALGCLTDSVKDLERAGFSVTDHGSLGEAMYLAREEIYQAWSRLGRDLGLLSPR